MPVKSLVLFFTLISLSPALAAEPAATKPDRTCSAGTDPLEEGARVSEGSLLFKGMCVETARVRPARNVKVEGNKLTFNNYYYDKQFWKAELDLTKVEAALFHVKPFTTIKGVLAAHTQLRFRMRADAPIQLTSQKNGNVASTTDLLVTFETADLRNHEVNFAVTFVPNYPIVGRVGHSDTFLEEKNRPLEQYELKLTTAENGLLLRKSLERSEALGLGTFYVMLRPNCASEAIDLIDALPGKKSAPHFLAVISTDPVAGPALQALADRGVLGRRVQDYEDEKRGITKVIPITKRAGATLPFIPSVSGLPWTAVLVGPDLATLTDREKKELAAVKRALLTRVFQMAQSYASATMVNGVMNSDTRTRLLLSALQASQNEITGLLKGLESSVPSHGRTLGVYLVPMKSARTTTSLESLGLPAALPFAIQEVNAKDASGTKGDVFYEVGSNALAASDQGVKDKAAAAFLMGTAVVANILPGETKISTQFLLGLNPAEHAVKSYNEKARIETLVVPASAASASRLNRAVMIVTHRQSTRAPLERQAEVEFGPFGGLAGTMQRDQFGGFQVMNPLLGGFTEMCEMRAQAVPRFVGTFGAAATGKGAIDALLKGRPLAFHLLGLRFDLGRLAVADVNLGVTSWPVNCAKQEEADAQFTEQANVALEDLKKKLSSAKGEDFEKIVKKLLGQ